jgi:hypothetical protein
MTIRATATNIQVGDMVKVQGSGELEQGYQLLATKRQSGTFRKVTAVLRNHTVNFGGYAHPQRPDSKRRTIALELEDGKQFTVIAKPNTMATFYRPVDSERR